VSLDHVVALAIGTCWATLVVAAVGLPSAARHPQWRPPVTSAPPATTPARATWITHLGATIRRHVTRWPSPAPTPTDSRAVPAGHFREATIRPDRDSGRPSYTPLTPPPHTTNSMTDLTGRHTLRAPHTRRDASHHTDRAPTDPAGRDTARPSHTRLDPPPHTTSSLTDPPHHSDRAPTDRADRRTGWAALAGLALLPVAPTLAPVPLACALALPALSARADRRRHETALVDQLPDVVDLLALTTAAGLPVSGAITAIADRPGGPLGGALCRASAHIRHGGTLAGALALVAAIGPPVRPLADALAHHDRYGSPLVPALERVGIEARARRRRHAEEAARRLPVTLLFPLVLTTFPAFVVLTVVPLLAGSLGSLSP
jgi:tight adherence protein C